MIGNLKCVKLLMMWASQLNKCIALNKIIRILESCPLEGLLTIDQKGTNESVVLLARKLYTAIKINFCVTTT